jgi:hypothetical protein
MLWRKRIQRKRNRWRQGRSPSRHWNLRRLHRSKSPRQRWFSHHQDSIIWQFELFGHHRKCLSINWIRLRNQQDCLRIGQKGTRRSHRHGPRIHFWRRIFRSNRQAHQWHDQNVHQNQQS